MMVSFEESDVKKIGFGLTGLGVTFTLVGVFLFFDKSFVAIGNILFLSGVTLTSGVMSTLQFFMKQQNFKGSASFAVGFFLIMLGWPVLGMIGEIYGLFVMFSGFWFTVFLRKLPIIGGLFRQSPVAFNVKGLTWAYETPFEDYSLTVNEF